MRHTFPLAACLSEEQAEERKNHPAQMALRLREAGHVDKIANLVGTAAT